MNRELESAVLMTHAWPPDLRRQPSRAQGTLGGRGGGTGPRLSGAYKAPAIKMRRVQKKAITRLPRERRVVGHTSTGLRGTVSVARKGDSGGGTEKLRAAQKRKRMPQGGLHESTSDGMDERDRADQRVEAASSG